MRRLIVLTAFATFLLSSCGGGGGGSTSSASGPGVVSCEATQVLQNGICVTPQKGKTPAELLLEASKSINATKQSNMLAVAQAYQNTSTIVPYTSPLDCTFEWAEKVYPYEFINNNTPSITSVSGEFTYRYYKDSNTYIGVSSIDKHLYYFSPSVNPNLVDLGEASLWYAIAKCGNPSVGIRPLSTSYQNAKNPIIGQITLPSRGYLGQISAAYGVADFHQTGNMSLFIANVNHMSQYQSLEEVNNNPSKYLSDFEMWHKNINGSYVKVWSKKGCLVPRKALVADFNQDGYPDIFVACHGHDAPPFGGETNKLVLSDGKGGFLINDASSIIGYYHGASAADLNGDGYPDIVVSSAQADRTRPYTRVLINNKDGTFTEDFSRFVNADDWKNYFSMELIDLNGDGNIDLIAGYDEDPRSSPGAMPITIFYGSSDGRFDGRNTFIIPSVPNRSIVLDFNVVTNNGKKGLFLSRTSGGFNTDGSVGYQSAALQWIDLVTFKSTIVFDQIRLFPATFPGAVFWWVPATKNGQNGIIPYIDDFSKSTPKIEFVSY